MTSQDGRTNRSEDTSADEVFDEGLEELEDEALREDLRLVAPFLHEALRAVPVPFLVTEEGLSQVATDAGDCLGLFGLCFERGTAKTRLDDHLDGMARVYLVDPRILAACLENAGEHPGGYDETVRKAALYWLEADAGVRHQLLDQMLPEVVSYEADQLQGFIADAPDDGAARMIGDLRPLGLLAAEDDEGDEVQ